MAIVEPIIRPPSMPYYKAFDYPDISRGITLKEYKNAIRWAEAAGLTNVEIQGMRGLKS